VFGLLGPPPAPKKVGSSKTILLMSCKHTLSRFFIYLFIYSSNLFTCETEHQQQQRQQQQKLNFFEKIGGKNLSHFPTQVSQNKKKNREKETSLLKLEEEQALRNLFGFK
jgi:hypothetical protein